MPASLNAPPVELQMRKLLIGALLVLGLAIALSGSAYYLLSAPLNVSAQGQLIIIAPGTSMIRLAANLGAEQVVAAPKLWEWYARISGKAADIQAGEYALSNQMTALELLQQIREGKVKLHSLTIFEGSTTADLLQALRGNEYLQQTLPADVPVWDLVADLGTRLGLPYAHGEGLFYPDTYKFPRGTSDVALLQQAAERQLSELAAAWEQRVADPFIATPYELLILASIIERETAVDAERAEIAGVFLRRLQRLMRLQTDPTVIYGLAATFNGNLTRQHLQTDTPYNTYTRNGLPPTPIALPARASLQAAALPATGNALYFVALGDGSGRHAFSDTLEAHNNAVAAYLKRLRSQS